MRAFRFIPSFSAGTVKTRDRSNPPVTAKILHEITKRWGVNRTKWVVELCFDDLLNWNTWMYNRRRTWALTSVITTSRLFVTYSIVRTARTYVFQFDFLVDPMRFY